VWRAIWAVYGKKDGIEVYKEMSEDDRVSVWKLSYPYAVPYPINAG
jgi:hypothetical protein